MVGYLKRSSRKVVEGSRRGGAFYDTWLESIDFVFDGVVTEEVCERIVKALHSANVLRPRQSSRGALRYMSADTVHQIDAENKQVLICCTENYID